MSTLASTTNHPSPPSIEASAIGSLLRGIHLPSWLLVGGLTLLCGLVFLTAEHRWDRSGLKDYVESAAERADAASSGNNIRRFAFLNLGIAGGLLFLASGRVPAIREPMGMCLMLAIAWTYGSLLWADAFGFTLKRLLLLTLCASGVIGIASCVSLRQMAIMVLAVTTAYLGMGIIAEILQGNFRPWASGYRFSGTLHPNAQASNCGAMAFSALALTRRSCEEEGKRFGRRRRLLRLFTGGLFLAALLFLLMTKSRTALAGTMLILGLTWSARKSLGTNLVVGGVGLLLALTLTYTVVVSGVGRDVGETANLGRADSKGAFNGRLPIWEICLRRLGNQAAIGCGYDGFWTGDRIEDVSWELGWDISSAHSEYIELVLGLGVVGLLLYVGVQFSALAWFWWRYQKLGYGGDGLMFGLLLIGVIQGFMETGFLHPASLGPFITLCGIARLAFFTDQQTLHGKPV